MNAKPYYEDNFATIYHGDALEVLAALRMDGAEFDLLTLDPPYNVGKDYGPGSDDSLSAEDYASWLMSLMRFGQAVANQLVYFPGTVNVPTCFEVLAASGWTFQRQLGWHKKEYAGDLFAAGPAMCWEPIMWATAGSQERFWNRVYGAWGRDFLVVNSTHGDPLRRHHPCPKPPEVLRWLIGLFCPPTGVVLDPTMGTGTSLVAAKYLSRRSVGIERNEAYCEVAATRLAQEVLDFGGVA